MKPVLYGKIKDTKQVEVDKKQLYIFVHMTRTIQVDLRLVLRVGGDSWLKLMSSAREASSYFRARSPPMPMTVTEEHLENTYHRYVREKYTVAPKI
ncbi:hypothetical protein PoB_005051100 [Plakobranchus ocellatus]|uniref:Uncharacterized protein n=1 Tax=Plakobranchus ocellatus TaxID=259542 RepID=A0AAV4BU38_9GAST|nr:hypothetical protein PoB_005051100 [Plakobranchus ocellatus]